MTEKKILISLQENDDRKKNKSSSPEQNLMTEKNPYLLAGNR